MFEGCYVYCKSDGTAVCNKCGSGIAEDSFFAYTEIESPHLEDEEICICFECYRKGKK